jgi:hypothetical protein
MVVEGVHRDERARHEDDGLTGAQEAVRKVGAAATRVPGVGVHSTIMTQTPSVGRAAVTCHGDIDMISLC